MVEMFTSWKTGHAKVDKRTAIACFHAAMEDLQYDVATHTCVVEDGFDIPSRDDYKVDTRYGMDPDFVYELKQMSGIPKEIVSAVLETFTFM